MDTHEVLGGLHTFLAKVELEQEVPSELSFIKVTAEVYVELSDDEALRLAVRHSLNSHFSHKMTQRFGELPSYTPYARNYNMYVMMHVFLTCISAMW